MTRTKRGFARLLLAVFLLGVANVLVLQPSDARELSPTAPTVQELTAAKLKTCVKILMTGDDYPTLTVDDCVALLKFDQHCAKHGMYVAQTLTGTVVCDKAFQEATVWEEAEFLLEGIAKGVITAASTAGPYVMTAVHAYACVYGEIISCAILAKEILDLAGVDVPYGELLGSAILAAECYEGNYVACVEFADSVGVDKAPLVGAAFAKSKETLKTSIYVVNCIDDQTASQCSQAIGMVGKQAGIKLPVEWANDFYAMLTQCEDGNIGSCIKAAEMIGLPKDSLVAKAFDAWEKGAQKYQSVQACLVQGNLESCGAAAGSVVSSYAPYLPQDFIKTLEADLKACANGDAKACDRAADALGVPGDKAVEAATKKGQQQGLAISTDVPDEDEGSNKQAVQSPKISNTSAIQSGAVVHTNGNDNSDASEKPAGNQISQSSPQAQTSKPQVASSNTSSQISAVPPAGFKEQASYSGDCSKRPAGTLCLNFTDAYVWLVTDKIVKHEDRGTVAGHPLRVEVGQKAEYHHLLYTKYVREVKK